MKPAIFSNATEQHSALSRLTAQVDPARQALVTRFGERIDVRNRGTLKVGRFAGSHAEAQHAPAVVRIWTDDQCCELTSHQARALAAQLLAAANLADAQNSH
jgi:hypothetical protein